MIYKGPYWILISTKTGMPIQVEKCTFKPTILPFSDCDWHEANLAGLSRRDLLASRISGHMDAMRPLLEEWLSTSDACNKDDAK